MMGVDTKRRCTGVSDCTSTVLESSCTVEVKREIFIVMRGRTFLIRSSVCAIRLPVNALRDCSVTASACGMPALQTRSDTYLRFEFDGDSNIGVLSLP